MKDSLKTFPKARIPADPIEQKYHIWAIRFEKELREKKPTEDELYRYEWANEVNELIKEILGE